MLGKGIYNNKKFPFIFVFLVNVKVTKLEVLQGWKIVDKAINLLIKNYREITLTNF